MPTENRLSIHWEWHSREFTTTETRGGYRMHLCATSERERDQEGSIILRPHDKSTKKPPTNECKKCKTIGTEAGIP